MAAPLGRPSPDPGLGSVVELFGGHLHRSLDLTGIGKALTGERIAAEEPPPTFLEIEPTGSFRDEDVLETRMVCQPGARLQAVVTAQVVGDNKDIARGIVRFDLFEQFNVIFGIPRRGTTREFLAIADPQRSIDPRLVIPATVLQWRLDAMAIG